MNLNCFKLHKPNETEWRLKKGSFSTWKVDHYYWHGPTEFDLSNKTSLILFYYIKRVPRRKIWSLSGVRQHLLRRLKKIKGFIPFIGIDILYFKIVFVFYQVRPIRPKLNLILNTFSESEAHRGFKNRFLSK